VASASKRSESVPRFLLPDSHKRHLAIQSNPSRLSLPGSPLKVYPNVSTNSRLAERILRENEEDLREKIKPPCKPDEIKRPHRLSQYKDNDINHRSGGRQNNKTERMGDRPCQSELRCTVTQTPLVISCRQPYNIFKTPTLIKRSSRMARWLRPPPRGPSSAPLLQTVLLTVVTASQGRRKNSAADT
jgi:hypothetical protein